MAVQPGTVFDSFMNAYLGRSGGLLPRTQGMFADRDLEQRQYEFGKNLAQQMAQMAEQRRQFAIQQRNGLISSIIGAVAGTAGAVGGAAASGGMKPPK
ncbi:MAG: hypothetical protein EBR82_86680 [Caulobacteraceae bacterium]|nr:hypothetical protein [Caulobacteraceae bacterium]